MPPPIVPCLWFNLNAEEAVNFYLGIFKNSRIKQVTHYGEVGPLPKGTVLTISFELNGQEFIALNGGPQFQFTGAVSFYVNCKTQAEIDHYWNALTEGGQELPCGWLTDKFGVTWQVVPEKMWEWMADPTGRDRLMKAFMPMKKLDMAVMEQAFRKV